MFTVKPILYGLVTLWGVYNPEGYFCGSYLAEVTAQAKAAELNGSLAA